MQPKTMVNRGAVAEEWARRGYSCELWVDPPDRVWSDFVHEADLLLLLLEGVIQVELPDRTVRLQVGDELDIPADTRFTLRHAGDQPASWLHGYRRSI